MSTLRTTRQATAFVEKDGRVTLAYWLQFRIGTSTRSLAVVFAPERTLFPRDKIALGFRHAKYDVRFGEFRTWIQGAGYRICGEIVEADWVNVGPASGT